jgi:hypothetical protein
MKGPRTVAVALLVVIGIAGTSVLNASTLGQNSPMYWMDTVYSDNGNYVAAAVSLGPYGLALGFSYVGPGDYYDIWFSNIDGYYGGPGSHQNHWATCDTGGHVVLQGDGNLVLYDSNNSPCWASGTNSATYLNVQNDGNLVLYDSGDSPVWAVF